MSSCLRTQSSHRRSVCLQTQEKSSNLQSKSDLPFQLKEKKSSSNIIPGEVQSKMEAAFQSDFSNVNIVPNSQQAEKMGAKAYASGNEIHFASGEYNPNTESGQKVLGHELAHVVQQRQGRVQENANIGGISINMDAGLENEADSMGDKATQFKFPHTGLLEQDASENFQNELHQYKKETEGESISDNRSMLLGPNYKSEASKNNPIQSVNQFLCGGSSKPTIEDLQKYNDYMSKADQAAEAGEYAFQALGRSDAAASLSKGRNALSKVSGPLGKGLKFADHASNLTKAAMAIDNLNGMDISSDPHGAARQFDILFSTVGKIGSSLPIPGVSGYFEILAGCGNFFSNMAVKLRPGARWSKEFREYGMPELAE